MKSSKLPDINTLSLEEQVAQMLAVQTSGYLFDHEIKYPQWEAPAAKLQHLVADIGVGGVILLGGSAAELPGCRGAGVQLSAGRGTRERERARARDEGEGEGENFQYQYRSPIPLPFPNTFTPSPFPHTLHPLLASPQSS